MGSGSSDPVELTVRLIHETDRAVLVTDDGPEEAVWLPKSQIEIKPEGKRDLHVVTLPEWLAYDNGLI